MITLLVGQLLPWLLGSAWIAALWRPYAEDRSAIVLGYGYLAGTIALTLWMRALSFAGIAWGWTSIGLPLLLVAAGGLWRARSLHATILRWRRVAPSAAASDGVSHRCYVAIWWMFIGLVCVHLLLAGLEIVWRPVFPWDSWTQWATKARVWYEMQRMVSFADFSTWLGGNAYIDAAPGYPANVPLLQAWACITLGHWDDSLMSIPSLFLVIALALGFYGQLRHSGHGALFSAAGTYAVVSLPFLDTHVALAGYADFPLAVYYGLAAIALWQWTVSRERAQLVLAILLAVACPMTKNPGWAWMATLVPAIVVTLLPRRGLLVVAGGALVAAIVFAIAGRMDLTVMGYQLRGTFNPVWEPLWQNYFEFANWHLLWYLLPALMLINAKKLFRPPLIAATMMVLGGLALLFVVFSFSNAAAWVADYSTVNRATLHLAPLMVFYALLLADAALCGTASDAEVSKARPSFERAGTTEVIAQNTARTA